MSDRLPGTSYDNPIYYRGYRIHIGPAYTRDSQWQFAHEEWDGAPTYPGDGPADRRYGMASTVDECKAEIDDIEEDIAAIATEARRAETENTGSVHEGAGPKDIAQSQPLGNPLDTGDGK